jgi:hypothetical protein
MARECSDEVITLSECRKKTPMPWYRTVDEPDGCRSPMFDLMIV